VGSFAQGQQAASLRREVEFNLGNFLVTVPLNESLQEAKQVFDVGLESALCLLHHVSNARLEKPWAHAAIFPRLNGSQGTITSHPHTESWLFVIGTWFHRDGYANGSEMRLLERYLEVGAGPIGEELEGFFVVVLGDGRVRETVVITDVVGSCHCFCRRLAGVIALSGSSLLLASLAPFEIDQIACQEFLRTGIIYEDRTFYNEVRKLGPASALRFGPCADQSTQKYWSVGTIEPESIRGSQAAYTLWNCLTNAAVKISRTFPKPVCDLTGGYDSRALVSAFWAAGIPVATVVSGPEESADVVLSRRLAQIAGLPHQRNPSSQSRTFKEVAEALSFTDGEYDMVEYARILEIHRSMMNHFDISINGSFGELARGYWWELLFPKAGARARLDAKKVGRLRFAATSDDSRLFSPEALLDLESHFACIIERTNTGLFGAPNTQQMDHAYLAMRMQRWQGRIASSTNRIWPCLSPFMFRSVLETMLAIQVRLRRRGLVVRQMLAEFRPDWAAVPLEHGYPAMPATWKSLHRFLPMLEHYGGKAWSKAFGNLGRRRAANATPSDSVPIRLQLWSEDEVHSILDFRTMKLNGLLEAAALRNFLKQSQERSFRFEAEWNRLLSLEYTQRILARAQIKRSA
jgi:hypothetical protein